MAPPLPMRRDATLGLDHEFAEVRRHGVQANIRAGCQPGSVGEARVEARSRSVEVVSAQPGQEARARPRLVPKDKTRRRMHDACRAFQVAAPTKGLWPLALTLRPLAELPNNCCFSAADRAATLPPLNLARNSSNLVCSSNSCAAGKRCHPGNSLLRSTSCHFGCLGRFLNSAKRENNNSTNFATRRYRSLAGCQLLVIRTASTAMVWTVRPLSIRPG